jgi:hypothetical protein
MVSSHVLSTIFIWHLYTTEQSGHVARMVWALATRLTQERILISCGYPNLSMRICWISPRNRYRHPPL